MVKKGLVNRARRDGRVNVVSMLERIFQIVPKPRWEIIVSRVRY